MSILFRDAQELWCW
jgi:hypothetical protein